MIPCKQIKCLVYSACRYRQVIRCKLLHDHCTELSGLVKDKTLSIREAIRLIRQDFLNLTMVHQDDIPNSEHRWGIPKLKGMGK